MTFSVRGVAAKRMQAALLERGHKVVTISVIGATITLTLTLTTTITISITITITITTIISCRFLSFPLPQGHRLCRRGGRPARLVRPPGARRGDLYTTTTTTTTNDSLMLLLLLIIMIIIIIVMIYVEFIMILPAIVSNSP